MPLAEPVPAVHPDAAACICWETDPALAPWVEARIAAERAGREAAEAESEKRLDAVIAYRTMRDELLARAEAVEQRAVAAERRLALMEQYRDECVGAMSPAEECCNEPSGLHGWAPCDREPGHAYPHTWPLVRAAGPTPEAQQPTYPEGPHRCCLSCRAIRHHEHPKQAPPEPTPEDAP